MTPHALVTHARRGWQDEVHDLPPGAHVAVFADNADAGIEGRLVGLELRDTLLVLWAGPKSSFVFLFRKPCAENTVANQMGATATGAINVDACRVATGEHLGRPPRSANAIYAGVGKGTNLTAYDGHEDGRWPSNVVLMHGPGCGTTECEPECPAPLLDQQSEAMGMHSAGSARDYAASTVEPGYNKNWGKETYGGLRHGDSGGASRFYPQFRDEPELLAWIERLITPALPGA